MMRIPLALCERMLLVGHCTAYRFLQLLHLEVPEQGRRIQVHAPVLAANNQL